MHPLENPSRRACLQLLGGAVLTIPLVACAPGWQTRTYQSELINVVVDVITMVVGDGGYRVGGIPEARIDFYNPGRQPARGRFGFELGRAQAQAHAWLSHEDLLVPAGGRQSFRMRGLPLTETGLHRARARTRVNYRIADFLVS